MSDNIIIKISDSETIEISKNDLMEVEVRTRDLSKHYFHKEHKCFYSYHRYDNTWSKPNETNQKQLLFMSRQSGITLDMWL